ncbi:MAG: right-handed parallel beta-helix repeat-containing protein [Burkholderiaceae bacterium]
MSGTPRSSKRKALRAGISMVALFALSALIAVWALDTLGIAPRRLAPYLEFRTSGHNSLIEDSGNWLASSLRSLDRGEPKTFALPRIKWISRVDTATATEAGNVVPVNSADAARRALAAALPGDVITFAPGIYRFEGSSYLEAKQSGRPMRPITVRAERPGTVQLEFDLVEGFLVTGPYWTFENLTIRGVCQDHSRCEHAFHVVGAASHFIARNNTTLDFNAHFKINGSGNRFPDDGLIEGNVLKNSGARRTGNPVTLIDLVAASDWVISDNQLSDFVKQGGDQISYGAFAKGAGERNRFERNVVVCEDRIRNAAGQRVGLSLGGGGTGKPYCRDRRCITEQQEGVIRANLIASCSDDGIYLNKAAASVVNDNTLLDTGPLVVRFAESGAQVEGNLVDSAIESRDGSILHQTDNFQTSIASLYLGRHPVRKLFVNTSSLDLRWVGTPPRRQRVETLPDLCGTSRPVNPTYGAFEDFSKC